MKTLKDLKPYIWRAIVRGLGPLAPKDVDSTVRFAWGDMPGPTRNSESTILTIHLTPTQDNLSQPIFSKYTAPEVVGEGQGTRVDGYTRVWKVTLSIYGVDSLEWGTRLAMTLYSPEVGELLGAGGLSLGRLGEALQRVPEYTNQEWWEKSIYVFYLNEWVELDAVPQAYIESVDISVDTGGPTGGSGKNPDPSDGTGRPGESQVPEAELPDRVIQGGNSINVHIFKS